MMNIKKSKLVKIGHPEIATIKGLFKKQSTITGPFFGIVGIIANTPLRDANLNMCRNTWLCLLFVEGE